MSEQSDGPNKSVGGNDRNNPANNNPGFPEGNRRPGSQKGRQVYFPPQFEGLYTDLKKHVYDVSQVTNNYDVFSFTT